MSRGTRVAVLAGYELFLACVCEQIGYKTAFFSHVEYFFKNLRDWSIEREGMTEGWREWIS